MNKYEEALEKIKSRLPLSNTWIANGPDGFEKIYKIYVDKDEVDLFQELVLKQTPVVVEEIGTLHFCPRCQVMIRNDDLHNINYCSNCGVRIQKDIVKVIK